VVFPMDGVGWVRLAMLTGVVVRLEVSLPKGDSTDTFNVGGRVPSVTKETKHRAAVSPF
jgi:hypothetical protein